MDAMVFVKYDAVQSLDAGRTRTPMPVFSEKPEKLSVHLTYGNAAPGVLASVRHLWHFR